MTLQIDPHTLERAEERGVTFEEIKEVLETGLSIQVKNEKLGKTKIFNYKEYRNNKYYEQKKVDVIYLIKGEIIITVTVYAFYGKWE